MLGDRQRKALRLIAEALLVLSEDPAEEAPTGRTTPPAPTRDRIARVKPTHLDQQRARTLVSRLGLKSADDE